MTVYFDTLNATAVQTFGICASAGSKATYTPANGAPFALDGVFDKAWRDDEPPATRHAPRMGISTTRPVFGCRLADFPPGVSPAQDDRIDIPNAGSFTVVDPRPDGLSGWVHLFLT